MKGHIKIDFDTATGSLAVDAPMSSQIEKDLTVKVLSGAIGAVIDFRESLIIKPAGTMPIPAAVNEGPKIIN